MNLVKKQKYSTQPISWALFISRLIRFFQTGFHDIKVFEKDNDDEYDRLLNDDKDKDDDFSDNETSRRSVDSQKSIHRHSRKCNHHHQQNKTTEEIVATKTAIITADERV